MSTTAMHGAPERVGASQHDRGVSDDEQDFAGRSRPAARDTQSRRMAGPRPGPARRGAALQPCGVGSAAGAARSGRHPGAAGQDPGIGPGADPLRPDAHLGVRLLPGRGRADGLGSGPHADHRHPGAVLRRRAPAQLRHVRRAGPAPGLRRQRLRRDAPGAVRLGRQAAGGQHRRRRPRQRLQRQGSPPGRAALRQLLPRADGALRARCGSCRCGTPGSTWTR